MKRVLTPFEGWMAQSNLDEIRNGSAEATERVALLRANGYPAVAEAVEFLHIQSRLNYLRRELRAERLSYGELAELQSLANHIPAGDVELREAAGLPESQHNERKAA